MAKRKVVRESNKPLTFTVPNPYDLGGALKKGLSSGIGSAVGQIGGNLISGGLESGAGSAISNIGGTIGGAISTVNPLVGGIVSAGSGILGGITNALFGSKLNKENIQAIENSNTSMNALMVDDSSNQSILDQWSQQTFGEDFTRSDIGKDGLFSNKAKNKYKELKREQDAARNRVLATYDNAISNVDTQNDLNVMANFSAYGGPINMWGLGDGAISYELAKEDLGIKTLNAMSKNKITSLPNSFTDTNAFAKGGKIHIKKANRGKFTKYCGGKVTSECIARGKRSSDPAVRKRAVFAQNARKFKHSYGGFLEGMEYDLDESIVKDLISRGYEIEHI